MKQSTLILIIILAFFFTFTLVLLYLNLNLNKNIPSTVTQEIGITSTTIPTTDPTINWKTYTHDKCGNWPTNQTVSFVYKLPQEMTEIISNKFSCCTDYTYSSADLSITFTCGDGFGGGCDGDTPTIQDVFKTANSTISGCLKKYSNKIGLHDTYIIPTSSDKLDHPGISITAQGTDSTKNIQLINQIISTFKFTDNATSFSSEDSSQGWYWGAENQKKINTPADWVFTEAGRSSCWHAPNSNCDFFPLPD
ncbi:MAG: hypothetical protein WC503_05330 [Candidatus Shapirobacteria bacterium]